MKLVKEMPFGKAIARVTVEIKEVEIEEIPFVQVGRIEIEESTKVEIIFNGQVVDSDTGVSVMEYNEVFAQRWEQTGTPKNEPISSVGNAMTAGSDAGNNINQAIKEMIKEIADELEVETESQKEEKNKIERANKIVKQAEKEGIENLMTNDELKRWMTNYNNVMNEGGEGFIPSKVSKEQYEQALATLK